MVSKHNQGFTLIELLIVIAIIGILAAVLIPNLLASRVRARNTAANIYANSVYKAGHAYLADNISATVADIVVACGDGEVYNPGAAASYTVPDPGGSVNTCSVTPVSTFEFVVQVTSPTGAVYTYP